MLAICDHALFLQHILERHILVQSSKSSASFPPLNTLLESNNLVSSVFLNAMSIEMLGLPGLLDLQLFWLRIFGYQTDYRRF